MEEVNKEKREAAFNVSRLAEDEPKESENLEDIEENLVTILKRGIGKYKSKLPLKFFEYVRIGHYASKCICKKDYKKSDDDEKKSRFIKYDLKKMIDDRGKK